jgi:hypothetical protein
MAFPSTTTATTTTFGTSVTSMPVNLPASIWFYCHLDCQYWKHCIVAYSEDNELAWNDTPRDSNDILGWYARY